MLFLRICTICCMREAVYISYGSHILPSPLGLARPRSFNLLFAIFQLLLLGAMVTRPVQGPANHSNDSDHSKILWNSFQDGAAANFCSARAACERRAVLGAFGSIRRILIIQMFLRIIEMIRMIHMSRMARFEYIIHE